MNKTNPTNPNAMEICVVGVGYVGLVTAGCLAHMGNTVVGVDDDPEKIAGLRRGKLPIYEPFLEELVRRGLEARRLRFTESLADAIASCPVIFICVGTPPLEDGEADLSSIHRVVRQVGELADGDRLIVEKSTVPVTTGAWIKKTLRAMPSGQAGRFDVAANPEFLRGGSAVEDFLHPQRIVIGVDRREAADVLLKLYGPVIERSFQCPIHHSCPPREAVPVLVTDIVSAELIKYAANAFLAMKISYINVIADLCEKVGADVTEVARGLGLDRRIGGASLQAGIGFGGSCLPKDLQAFVRTGEKHGCDLRLLKEVEQINVQRVEVAIKKVRERLGPLQGKTVAVLGLSFKPNTDDIRSSPGLEIVRRLLQEEARVKVYDPRGMVKAKEVLGSAECCESPYEALTGADAGMLVTEWDEFKSLDLVRLKQVMRRRVIIDGRNIFDRRLMESLGFEYSGMGR
jgi:UDPglucose 6-dehydrogenase